MIQEIMDVWRINRDDFGPLGGIAARHKGADAALVNANSGGGLTCAAIFSSRNRSVSNCATRQDYRAGIKRRSDHISQ